MSKKFYAVAVGYRPGIYEDWYVETRRFQLEKIVFLPENRVYATLGRLARLK
jgi:hypothetical protein